MIRFPKSPLKSLSGFFKKEDGTAAVELVVLVPVLSFITFSMVTFTMAFKEKTQAIRATSVVTDMISREVTPITPEYGSRPSHMTMRARSMVWLGLRTVAFTRRWTIRA